ncbi:hypothetical protein FQA47_008185 [Oryzias melastigma]|uniref:Uncharacterized protein n=1 Tax=Oryzias melastigma TaxID=30732 RepID=A0A834F1U2_ORYME|nr:hypothetical protein FQA47_008185 [Oryzias melastigma]
MDSGGFQCLHETKAGKEHPETAPLDPYSTPSGHGRLNLEEKLRLMLQKAFLRPPGCRILSLRRAAWQPEEEEEEARDKGGYRGPTCPTHRISLHFSHPFVSTYSHRLHTHWRIFPSSIHPSIARTRAALLSGAERCARDARSPADPSLGPYRFIFHHPDMQIQIRRGSVGRS